jgi:pimeloyl-ACP methyl ester carboxylesterase
MRSRQTLIHGLRICYDVTGDGPAILLIHGWAGSRLHWKQASNFLHDFRIIAPDLYGFGDSEEPAVAAIPDDYVDLLIRLIEELAVERCTLVGHSVGGLIAASLATRISGKLDGLVLIEAPVAGELGLLTCPILLVFGDKNSKMEGVRRFEVANVQAASSSSADVRFIDKAGHNPMLERPTEFYSVLHSFAKKRLHNA